jgi:hypothetical protein
VGYQYEFHGKFRMPLKSGDRSKPTCLTLLMLILFWLAWLWALWVYRSTHKPETSSEGGRQACTGREHTGRSQELELTCRNPVLLSVDRRTLLWRSREFAERVNQLLVAFGQESGAKIRVSA